MARLIAAVMCSALLLSPIAAAAQGIGSNILKLVNEPSGVAPRLAASGVDLNIDINLVPKGTGCVRINGGACIGGGGGGPVSGSGTTNTLPVWTNGPGGVLGDSIISQSGGVATVTGGFTVTTRTGTPATMAVFTAGGVLAETALPASSVTGTANQITASPTTGAVVLSLPSAVIMPGSLAVTTRTGTPATMAVFTAGGVLAETTLPGSGSVTSIATTSPITGGTITTTGTIGCATCVTGSGLTSGRLITGNTGQAIVVGDLSGDVTTSGGTVTTIAARYKVFTCTVTTGDPGAASPNLANDNDAPWACQNHTGSDVTITSVTCIADAGAPTVTPITTGGGATSILTGALTCGTATFAAGTLNGTPVLHSFSGTGATCSSTPCSADVNITTAGGTAKYLVVNISGTY